MWTTLWWESISQSFSGWLQISSFHSYFKEITLWYGILVLFRDRSLILSDWYMRREVCMSMHAIWSSTVFSWTLARDPDSEFPIPFCFKLTLPRSHFHLLLIPLLFLLLNPSKLYPGRSRKAYSYSVSWVSSFWWTFLCQVPKFPVNGFRGLGIEGCDGADLSY